MDLAHKKLRWKKMGTNVENLALPSKNIYRKTLNSQVLALCLWFIIEVFLDAIQIKEERKHTESTVSVQNLDVRKPDLSKYQMLRSPDSATFLVSKIWMPKIGC